MSFSLFIIERMCKTCKFKTITLTKLHPVVNIAFLYQVEVTNQFIEMAVYDASLRNLKVELYN